MLSEQELLEIEERWSKATKGPWHWTLSEIGKQVTLFNSRSMTVMDFARWGVRAIPRFRNDKDLMVKADSISEVVVGREHHASWYKSLNHPDAKAIEHAPEDVRKLLEHIRELKCK